jgi:aminotransferase
LNYDTLINPVVRDIPPSGIRKFFDIVQKMEGAISLGVGEPDFMTPWCIREAAIYSIEQGKTQYTANRGAIELRRAISKYLRDRFSLCYDPVKEILVTVGVSEGIDVALRAICGPGDEVLVPDPSYVSYAPGVALAGGKPVAVRTLASEDFRLRSRDIEAVITPRTKALILPYPNNPTGAVMEKKDLEALLPVIIKHDLFVLSDEVYAELNYGAPHVSIATLPGMAERTLLLSGMSKALSMTGWRIGYACGPSQVVSAMVKIHQYVIMCAPNMSQVAACEGLLHEMDNGYPEIMRMRRAYNRRRRVMLNGFREMGLPCFEPKGAFYCFPSITGTGLTSEEFCEGLLREEKVAVVPGTAFGASGEGHFRACYAVAQDKMEEALIRIRRYIERLEGK